MDKDNISAIPSVKAICFDIGDTLIFDKPSRKDRVGFALSENSVYFNQNKFDQAYGEMERQALIMYVNGEDIERQYTAFQLTRGLLINLKCEYDEDIICKVIQTYTDIKVTRYIKPESVNLLKQLKRRGFKLGVISDWDKNLIDLLKEHKIAEFFDSFSVSEIVGATKPNAKLFKDAVSKLDVSPNEVLHIGDYYDLDIAGARSIGMNALLYDSQNRYSTQALDVPVFRSFDELNQFLNEVQLSQ